MLRVSSVAPKTLAVIIAATVAVAGGVIAYAVNAWPRLENDTIDARFTVRGPMAAPSDVVIVAIDDRTFSELNLQWPFPRRKDAEVLDIVHRDGARAIAYDVQFTEPTDPTDDNRLFNAVAHAGHVVLATTEIDASGQTNVLGGSANLRAAHAVAAAANLPSPGNGVVRRYAASTLGLESFAVAAAEAGGHPVSPTWFTHDTAPIDFRGPPGTIRTVSFADVLRGRIDPRVFAGKIVVIGATAPTLQDLHQTSTTSTTPMAGVEVQANAIWTALHDNPLGDSPDWLAVLAILLCAGIAPVASLRLRVWRSAMLAVAVGSGYLLIAQLAFNDGTVLVVSYPIVAWTIGTIGMLGANYVAAFAERNVFSRRLNDSQRELIQRLAQAVESRDEDTGEHTYRIGVLSRRLALALGWSEADAQTLMYASLAHDIGKIGIPDATLLKPGPLVASEWETMKAHTTIGAGLLAGSSNPLVQMAETIALSHHERWDGTGYPNGLRGQAIPIEGRICAVVDVYDALVSKRVYKEAWQPDDVLAEIQRSSGTQFDPTVVAAFLALGPQLGGELQASFSRERSAAALAAAPA
jgi:CHASE2 domain-containing sensor protein